MLKAVIFDMDGLLLDTERPAVDAWLVAADELGLSLPRDVVLRAIGVDWAGTKQIMMEAVGEGEHFERLIQRMREIFHTELEANITVKPGVAEFLQELERRGMPVALATSTSRKSAQWKLEKAGLQQYFSCSACGDEVQRGKPYPDIFLLAARSAGAEPECCVALEDSPAGLKAAKAAGMKTIMVPDLVAPTAETSQWANFIAGDMYEASKLIFSQSIL